MAVNVAADRPRRVHASHFVRLKLRVVSNNFRGQRWRMVLFVVSLVLGIGFAASGFFLLAAPGLGTSGGSDLALLVAAFAGALLILGWLFLPLVFFGVDETLDPARFALLPLRRRTLLTGLLAASLVGVPAMATLAATAGLVVSAAVLGGWLAGLIEAVGVVGGLLLCVAISRAVTSAFATMLRSRRARDLAAVLLAVFAALLGPLQLAVVRAAGSTDWERLGGFAQGLGWTPLGAPYTVGFELAAGRAVAVPVKLLITALSIAALLVWWSRSVESAMVGASASGAAASRRGGQTGAVAQLFPAAVRWAPRNRYGALVAREARYWWRDTRRRASLITFAVVGTFVPIVVNVGSRGLMEGRPDFDASPTLVSLSMVFVGVLAGVTLANQFGFDGSSYAANVIAGVPGRLELRARIVAFSAFIVPLLVLIAAALGVLLREPAWSGVMAGTLFAGYGSALAVNQFLSVLGAYALPETANPFAVNAGAGFVRSLLSLVAMVASAAAAVPMVVATALLPDVWLWLALPVGVAYGVCAAALGSYLAGDVLDHRMPELLAAVTPRR